MFKSITKKIIALTALITFIAGSAFATSLVDPNGLQELVVGKKTNGSSWSGWKENSISIKGGDILYFDVHYYTDDCDINNIKAKLENLNGKTFNAGSTENVYSYMDGSGVSRVNDSVNVHFDEKVKLTFEKYSFQEGTCQSISCQTDGGTSTAILGSGYSIGNKKQNEYGNVIVKFRVEKVNEPQPVDGGWTNWRVDHRGSYSSCVNGEKTRTVYWTRSCTNPAPANGGAQCSGSSTKTTTETTSCETPVEADVDTNNPTSITRTSAKLNGDTDGTPVEDKWFAFSRTDSTPSCSSSAQRVEAYGNDNFYRTKSGLTCDTRYYFRACGEDANGNIVSGAIKSFRTDACERVEIPAVVYTRNATSIEKYSAQLNGYVDINDTENGRVYFIYGTSPSNMNIKTGESRVINDDTAFQSIVGLTPNTKYFYQAIIKNDDGIVDRGVIKNFVTKAAPVIVTPTNGKCGSYLNSCRIGKYIHILDSSTQYKWGCQGVNGGKNAICIINKPVRKTITRTTTTRKTVKKPVSKPLVVNATINETVATTTTTKAYEERGLKINKWVSTDKYGTYGLVTNAKIGDKVYYKIRVVNNSDQTIEDIDVKDFIPAELVMNGNSTDGVDKYVTYKISLQPGQSKTVITEMTLDDNAQVGEVIDSAAKITMDGVTEETNSVSVDVVADNTVAAAEKDNNLNKNSASIFGSNSSFIPTTIIGWLSLIILVLITGLLAMKIFTTATAERK